MTEAAYLLSSAGADGTLPIQFCLRGGAIMKAWTDMRAARAGDLMRKYCDVPMDYTNATLVALAEELDTPPCLHARSTRVPDLSLEDGRAFKIYPPT